MNTQPFSDAGSARHLLLLTALHETVRERLHEADQCIFLLVGQAEPPHALCIDVVGRFRRGPAADALPRIIGAAARQKIARVVEVHDRLEALEVTVVPIGFDEGWIGALVHIAKRRHPEACLTIAREREPAHIHGGGLAQRVTPGKKTADAKVDE